MKALLLWRQGLTLRERRLVDVAATLTALIVLVYGVIVPVGHAVDAAAARHAEILHRTARLEAQLATLNAPRQRPADRAGPLDQLVTITAQDAGLTIQSAQPRAGGRIAVAIVSARSAAALGWLDRLGAAGIVIETLALRPSPDGTLALDAVLHQP